MVFDQPAHNRASAVAAGLFNPVTGKRNVKSWETDKLFPYLFQFYSEAEQFLGRRFFYPQPVYRPFVSIEEQNEWMAQSESPGIKKIVENIFTSSVYGSQTYDEFGGIRIKQAGYLDTNGFMGAVRNYLLSEDGFIESIFDAGDVAISVDKIKYQNTVARGIVFCEGAASKKNPIWSWVPITPLKGETLSISLAEKPDVIFNRGVYIVPSGENNTYLVGATYRPGDQSDGVTDGAKSELVEKTNGLLRIPYKIHNQNWGIRPSTHDRRPILGAHPAHENVFIFNGLGTKGVSLAPYFSKVMTDRLAGHTEIQKEANIERYKSLYSKFSTI
jgi:hypothetical protein